MTYTMLGANGRTYQSDEPGTLGGWRPGKIYGQLDCPSALRQVERGNYAKSRVFFADEPDAVGAGYRPCFFCMPAEYHAWKAAPAA